MKHLPALVEQIEIMKSVNMARNSVLFLVFLLIGSTSSMGHDLNDSAMKVGAFSISQSGGLEYGSRKMSFDGEKKFYFAKGDTINDESQSGVGVFALDLTNTDVQQLKDVAQALCDKDIQTGGPETHDPAATFTVMCSEAGLVTQRSGSLRLIPEYFRHRVFDAPLRLSERARLDGRKIIKLDFTTVNVEHVSGHYVVSIRFINSGSRWIEFKTPDQWPGNAVGGGISIAPFGELGKPNPRGDWGFNLAGKRLINKEEFVGGVVRLEPGDGKILKFEAIPDNKIERGAYDMSGVAYMNIEYEGFGWGLSKHVDFCPIKSRIVFDQSYPSTAQEREQWEATHRFSMSSRLVRPGETFTEDGLYRAVRLTSHAYQSLQLRSFKAGDVATTDSVKMLMASGDGLELDGPVQWQWEGSAPTPVEPYSLDIIEDTRQFCSQGAECPRSGRWLPRVSKDWNSLHYIPAGIVTVRGGQPMPALKWADDAVDWEWIGA